MKQKLFKLIAFLLSLYFILSGIACHFISITLRINVIFTIIVSLIRVLFGILFLFYATGALGEEAS